MRPLHRENTMPTLAIATTKKTKGMKWSRKKQHGRPLSSREQSVANMDEIMLFMMIERGVYNAAWVRKVRARVGKPVPHLRTRAEDGEKEPSTYGCDWMY